MAQINQGGPGLGLPYPQPSIPAALAGAPYTPPTNALAVAPGEAVVLPAGPFMVICGKYTILQYLDPVMGIWLPLKSAPGVPAQISSDGVNFRIFNPTGCVVGAVVTAAGSGYTQATTSVTPSAGNSVWQPIIGGALNTSMSITATGSGYTIAPQVYIPAPPAGLGIPATAYASIANGTVSGVTFTNQGAGYTTAPVPVFYPSPYDPNLGSIVNATAKTFLTGAGTVTGVLCINPGTSQASAPTLSVAGGGTSASVTAVICQTATGVTFGSGGAGYGAGTIITSIGGVPAASPVLTNPATDVRMFDPRPATILPALSGTSLSSVSVIYDGGMFTGTPTPVVISTGIVTTAATVTLALGSAPDFIYMSPC